jgi:hypothetical protein
MHSPGRPGASFRGLRERPGEVRGGSFRLPAEDSNLPERPIEIRVWYLRGALDDDIGMIRALKVPGTQGTG